MAMEWADWVNSSPSQRQCFYKDRSEHNNNMSVQRELQKISTFNYIVENTVLKQDSPCQGSAFKPYPGQEQTARPSILRNSDQNKNNLAISSSKSYSESKSVQIQCSASQTNSSSTTVANNTSTDSTHNAMLPTSMRPCPIGQNLKASSPIGHNFKISKQVSNLSSRQSSAGNITGSHLQGFNAVREALMKTSSVIKDIDGMLDKK